jgi:hypothetical protein
MEPWQRGRGACSVTDEETPASDGAVGRVQLEPEPERWAAATQPEGRRGWSAEKLMLGAAALIIMVGLLVFLLWAALQPTPG